MIELWSIEELVNALEAVNGHLLIPDKEINWLWDGINHRYHEMDDRDREIIRQCFDTGSIHSRRRETETNGRVKTVKDVYVPVVRETDSTRMILKLSVDETEQSLEEKNLQHLLLRHSTIISNAPDAIIRVNTEGLVQSWNLAAENMLGYRAEDMMGKPVKALFRQEDFFTSLISAENVLPEYPSCLKRENLECITREETVLFCELTAVRMQTSTNVFETVLFLRDKTLQKKLQDQAQRSLENISKLNEISSLIHATLELNEILNMILVSATAGQGLRFNRAFLFLSDESNTNFEGRKAIGPSNPHEAGLLWKELEQEPQALSEILTGYQSVHDGRDFKVNQIVKKFHIPMSPEDPGDKTFAAIYRCLEQRRPAVMEEGQPDCPPIFIELLETKQFAVAPLVSKEGPVGLLIVDNAITGRKITAEDLATLELFSNQIVAALEKAVLYDKLKKKVSELEKAQASLRKSQKNLIRSEKLAAIGKLSAKMAHEIKNPLVAIGGFARTMLKADDVYNRSYLQIIAAETARLENILNDTLAYVRSSQPVLSVQALRPLIEETLALLSERFKTHGVTIHTEWLDDPELEFDPNQIKQSVVNILTNAIEAMPNGGDIFIRLSKEEEVASLRIEDTGEGIDEQNLSQIFDPFFTTKNKGSGIGLAVVHDILMRHSVEYDVHSSKNKGTTFHLRFRLPQ